MNNKFEKFLKEAPAAHRTVAAWKWVGEHVELTLAGSHWNDYMVECYRSNLANYGFNARVVSYEPGQHRGKQHTLTLRFV